MNNSNRLFVGIAIGAIAVFLILLLSGSWGGGGMMGPWMMGNPWMWMMGPWVMLFLAAIVIWAVESGKKK